MKIIQEMNDIVYPIIIFDKHNDSTGSISAYKKKFFTTTKDMIGFYKDIELIDSTGNRYEIEKGKFEKNLTFSLLYLKRLIKVKPVLKKTPSQINLEDLKIKVMIQIRLKPKPWLFLDTIDGIQKMVDNAKTYKELILIFK